MAYAYKPLQKQQPRESFVSLTDAINRIDRNITTVEMELDELLKLSKSMLREKLLLPHFNNRELTQLKEQTTIWSDTTNRFLQNQKTKGSKLAQVILLVLNQVQESIEYYKLSATMVKELSATVQVTTDKELSKTFAKLKYYNDEMRDELLNMLHMVNGEIVYNRLQSFTLRMNEFTILAENIDHEKHFALNLSHSKPVLDILKKDELALYRSMKQLRKHTKKARKAAKNVVEVIQDNKKKLMMLTQV